jgi:membrane protease YdiL (CAAX protease family)
VEPPPAGPSPAPAPAPVAASPGERTALVLSCALIVVFWIAFAAWKLTRGGDHPVPVDIFALFVRKAAEAAVLALVVGLLLRASRESFADLGVSLRHLGRSLLEGLGWAALLFVLINIVLNPFVGSLVGGAVDARTRLMFQDPGQAPWWVLTAIVGGGFAEELMRAFVLTRFDRLFGRAGLVAAVGIDSAVFGLGHLYQGPSGAISAGLTGVLFALIFLRRRRATDSMAAHALFDLMGIAVAYALYGPRG